MPALNRQIIMTARPSGPPTSSNFKLVESPIPKIQEGQLLLRTIYLSLDPYMRGRMSDAPSYAASMNVGEVMIGGTVCRVEASQRPGFKNGDLVLAYTGWQDYAISDGEGVIRLDPAIFKPSYALGVMGMPGFTAYFGLLDIGAPRSGETLVVAAATGAVGSVVGQIAKIKGCRVVGIAGGEEKCRSAVQELGFDVCLDHKKEDLPARLKEACPQGIDIYFENVGGAVFDAVLPLLNLRARIPLCGLVAHYNDKRLPEGPDRSPLLLRTFLTQRIKLQGFIVSDHYGERFDDFATEMRTWLQEGKIKFREDIVQGLENAPKAFIGLLEGRNRGKLLIQVSQE
jgi:NADPH-dependent curcumin reductase CurA